MVLIYGILKGVRDVSKKKALELNGLVDVLLVYTLISFVMVVPDVRNAGGVPAREMLLIAFKSFIIFGSFTLSFYTIKKMPVSLYGVLELSRLVFSMVLGVFVLGEAIGLMQGIGITIVIIGLLMLKFSPDRLKRKEAVVSGQSAGVSEKPDDSRLGLMVFLTLVSCFLGAASGVMDKVLMKTLTGSQLQFWYMLYLLIFYLIFTLITRTGINWKSVLKNPWVWVISILFIIADRCLFIANGIPESRVTVMPVLKQICVVVTIILGRIIFKEKHIVYRLICALVIIGGIAVSVL